MLTNITEAYGFHELITSPTRTAETTSTLIDVMFTNCPDMVVCSGVSHTTIGVHSLVYTFRKLSVAQSRGRTFVSYRKCNNFSFDISLQSWDTINNFDDQNAMWVAWKKYDSSNVLKSMPPCVQNASVHPNRFGPCSDLVPRPGTVLRH